MDENKIRQIISTEIENYATKNQYNASKIPAHTHDGLNSTQVSQKDIINNNKYGVEITSSDGLTPGGETFSFSNLPNINQVFFNGIVANNAADLTLAATKKASVNGVAQFGNCYGTPTLGTSSSNIKIVGPALPLLQETSSMYIDTTDLTKTTTLASSGYLVKVGVQVGAVLTVVATMKISGYTNSQLTMTTTYSSGWQITGFVIFI